MEIFNGFILRAAVEYADRVPLVNTTGISWTDSERKLLSNDPLNPTSDAFHFKQNQSFMVYASLQIHFAQKYIMRPEGKSVMGSKYPELSVSYRKAIPSVAGSDMDYDLINAGISDDIRFGLLGMFRYKINYGKFLRVEKMEFMDYHHFNGNKTIFADFSLNDFELLDYYRFATNREYVEAHGEYNLGGLILNKIPMLRNLKLNEIVGGHFFHATYTGTSAVKNYVETSFGIEKFGLLRADFVMGFDDGKKASTGFVLGLKINISGGTIRITE